MLNFRSRLVVAVGLVISVLILPSAAPARPFRAVMPGPNSTVIPPGLTGGAVIGNRLVSVPFQGQSMALPPGVNPFFQVSPGLTIGQAAFNLSTLGNALSRFPPWAFGANPYAALSAYPAYGYPGYGIGGYSYGYSSSYGSPYGYQNPYGGYMSGEADVIRGWGNYLVNQQNAALLRDKVREAKLDTRRRAFDEYLYERANAPTYEDNRIVLQHEELRRSLDEPPVTEVWSGKSLNTLLADVQRLQGGNRDAGPAIALDEDLLKQINVTAAPGRGNLGLLKDRGRLDWPIGLRILPPADESRDLRTQVDSLIQEALVQAANGTVDAGVLQELDRDVNSLQRMLVSRVEVMPMGTYITAKRFLSDLEDAVKLLRQPDAGQYVNGKYAAKGANVQALVKYLTDHGLQFAPGVPGSEAAYLALQRAFVRYDNALRSAEVKKEPGNTR
jgi:hypothetical protein